MTMPPDSLTDSDAANAFTRAVAAACQKRLGPTLLGAYLIGSLAHGGFSRRYSDIDMALIVEEGVAESAVAQIRAEAAGYGPALAPKLSLFWANRTFSIGRFPPLDRCDYLDHAVTLVERERIVPARPSLAQVREYLRGAPFATWAQNAQRFAALSALDDKDHKPFLRAMLYPARLIYSWTTGRMGSNDDAVAWLHEHPPPGLDLNAIETAMQCRRADRDPLELFSARGVLPGQVAACARVLDRNGSFTNVASPHFRRPL